MCPMAAFCTANRAASHRSVQAFTGHFLVTAKSKIFTLKWLSCLSVNSFAEFEMIQIVKTVKRYVQ